jgi:hypothetical protein
MNDFRTALSSELLPLHVKSFEASHRLAGLRRHLDTIAAEPPLTSDIGSFSALLVLLALTGLLFVLL